MADNVGQTLNWSHERIKWFLFSCYIGVLRNVLTATGACSYRDVTAFSSNITFANKYNA